MYTTQSMIFILRQEILAYSNVFSCISLMKVFVR